MEGVNCFKMTLPKYIKDKILLRAKYAIKFMELDCDICSWMQANNIDSEYSLPGYVESLCGGYSAAREVIKEIEEA